MNKRIDLVGGLGCGKSTLANALAPKGYELVLETIDGNPFLPLCYAGDERCMFPSQVWFIQKKTEELLLGSKNALSLFDQSLLNTRAYIDVTLDGDPAGKELMHSFVDWVEDKYGYADLYVVLGVSLENQVDRIKWRGREMEKTVSYEFVQKLQDRIDHYVAQYSEIANVVHLNTDSVVLDKYDDFVERAHQIIQYNL